MKSARRVAEVMAAELGRDQEWIEAQVKDFTAIASNYFLS
jgi:glycerol-3-phosphate dehydrogenase